MQDFSNYPPEDRPVVGIFSSYSALSVALAETFLASSCVVKIVSDDLTLWRQNTRHLKESRGLKFFDKESIGRCDYAVFIYQEGASLTHEAARVDGVLLLANSLAAKALFVLPFVRHSETEEGLELLIKKKLKAWSDNTGIIFIPEIFGPRMDFKNDGFVSTVLRGVATGEPVEVYSREKFCYPGFAPEVARQIAKNVFSFGPYGSELALVGGPVKPQGFLDLLKKLSPETAFVAKREVSVASIAGSVKKQALSGELQNQLKETLAWIKGHAMPEAPAETVVAPKTKKVARIIFKRNLIATLILAGGLPFFTLLFGALTLFTGLKILLMGNFIVSEKLLRFSKATSTIASAVSSHYSKIPLIGGAYKKVGQFATIGGKAAELSVSVSTQLLLAQTLTQKILGKSEYDVEYFSRAISLGLDNIYKEAGFLQGELDSFANSFPQLKPVIQKVNLEVARDRLLKLTGLTRELTEILGEKEKRVYLVLIQNNAELRPTGGFIGSFALVSFQGGRLASIDVRDVYSADGQLRGHVEPPAPIRKYLGEAGWFLRDSNWDPDFPVSAARAEWFLGKEIDVSVAGTVSVDLALIKNILKETGPVILPDYNLTIDQGNLYEKTQTQVESEFFPGSSKKASFLTALTRAVMARVTDFNRRNYLAISKAVFSSLEGRHLQIFLHNKNAQKAVSDLNWDGVVKMPACTGNCIFDTTGIVEANVGVNKVNRFITRKINFDVEAGEGSVARNLFVQYDNHQDVKTGLPYKVYVRALVPADGEIATVSIIRDGKKEFQDAEIVEINGRKEAGVLVEVFPQNQVTVGFSWKSYPAYNFADEGEYYLLFRKQAGTDADPIAVELSPDLRYNTVLSKDIWLKLPLKAK